MPAYNDLSILSYFFELVNTFLNNFFQKPGRKSGLDKIQRATFAARFWEEIKQSFLIDSFTFLSSPTYGNVIFSSVRRMSLYTALFAPKRLPSFFAAYVYSLCACRVCAEKPFIKSYSFAPFLINSIVRPARIKSTDGFDCPKGRSSPDCYRLELCRVPCLLRTRSCHLRAL